MEGCSVQYEENSVRDLVERMKAGAVMVERSPLKVAMDCESVSILVVLLKHDSTFRKLDQEPFDCGGTAEPSCSEGILKDEDRRFVLIEEVQSSASLQCIV
jgi:hypothetical protein